MASAYGLLLDGDPADDDFYADIESIEVEESLDLPAAIQFALPIDRTEDGDVTYAGDARIQPFAKLAVVAKVGSRTACVFAGFVLSHKMKLSPGLAGSRLEVWGQDSSWQMNLEEKTREWSNVSDTDVAKTIFGEYGIQPAKENGYEEAPHHTEAGHTLMQRGSDIQFLRMLARRTGRICRVACADSPDAPIGWFAAPKLDGDPVAVLKLNELDEPNVGELDLSWDVCRPTQVKARQTVIGDTAEDGVAGDADDSGLKPLDDQGLHTFAVKTMSVQLTAPVDDAGELKQRAQGLLRETGWFVRCEGETDSERLGTVLRPGDLVTLDGIGKLHSGNYLVWSVRHNLTDDAHAMKFVLVRNAVGPAGGSGGLLGLL